MSNFLGSGYTTKEPKEVKFSLEGFTRPNSRVYDRIGELKKLVWLHTRGHVDMYDDERIVGKATDAVVSFLEEHL